MRIMSSRRRPVPAPPGPDGASSDKPAEQFSVDVFAAELSRLSYARSDVIRDRLSAIGATHVRVLSSAPTWMLRGQMMGLACVYKGRGWIALRGTDEPDDWSLNVAFLPFTHPGFRLAWRMLAPETRVHARKLAEAAGSVVLTGHSLGGALAVLAAADLTADGIGVEAVVTFGAPRVASPRAARSWDNLPSHGGTTLGAVTRRYETRGEAVCHVPPFLFGFRHVGRPADFPSTALAPYRNGAILRRIRAAGAETFGLLAVPFLLLKLLVFAADREPYHRMDHYLRCFGTALPKFAIASEERDSDYSLAAVSPVSWVVLGTVILLSLALVGTLAWLTLSWSGMHPMLALAYLAIMLWAVPDTAPPTVVLPGQNATRPKA